MILEGSHHYSLEGSKSITEPKWHHSIGIGPPFCGEDCFGLVLFYNLDLVISAESIQEEIQLIACQCVQQLVCKRDREMILLSVGIQLSKVYIYSQLSIPLGYPNNLTL